MSDAVEKNLLTEMDLIIETILEENSLLVTTTLRENVVIETTTTTNLVISESSPLSIAENLLLLEISSTILIQILVLSRDTLPKILPNLLCQVNPRILTTSSHFSLILLVNNHLPVNSLNNMNEVKGKVRLPLTSSKSATPSILSCPSQAMPPILSTLKASLMVRQSEKSRVSPFHHSFLDIFRPFPGYKSVRLIP